MFIGIKYGHVSGNTSLSIAIKTDDGRIFLESIGCQNIRNGNGWIIEFLQSVKDSTGAIVIDGANGQQLLSQQLTDYRLKKPILPTVKEIITAHSAFELAIPSEGICHMAQPSLVQSVSNCEHRAIGSNGGFGYQPIREDVEITLLESAVLAYWAAATVKTTSSQRVSY